MPITIPLLLLSYLLQALCFLLWALACYELIWGLLLQSLASLAAFAVAQDDQSRARWWVPALWHLARLCFWTILFGWALEYLMMAAVNAIATNCLMYDVFHPQAPWYGCLLP